MKLAEVVTFLSSDSGIALAAGSQPMDTDGPHSYSSSGGPLRAPTDTESLQNFESVVGLPSAQTQLRQLAQLPEPQQYTSLISAPSVSQRGDIHQKHDAEAMDTTDQTSMPPTMSRVLNQQQTPWGQSHLPSTAGSVASSAQPSSVRYPVTSASQSMHRSYVQSGGYAQPPSFPSAGQLFSAPSEPSSTSFPPIIDRNPGLREDADRTPLPAPVSQRQPTDTGNGSVTRITTTVRLAHM